MIKTLRSTLLRTNVICNDPIFINRVLFFKRTVTYQKTESISEDEIVEALYPEKAPVHTRVPDFIKEAKGSKNTTIKNQKNKDVIIKCKNSKLNHYKNERSDKSKPLLLASKGWNHYKSKGDYFSIKVCDDVDYVDNLFWDHELKDFESFQLNPDLIDVLKSLGFNKPTKIQAKAIPKLISGRNSLITAETGCGKTMAYLIPVINQILEWSKHLPADRNYNSPLALILAPSRDLAQQISDIAFKLSCSLPFKSRLLVGGRTKRMMMNPQFEVVDLQIATPGVLSKLVSSGLQDVSNVKHVVLDEGDTMLDDSFNETLVRLLRKIKIRYAPPHKGQFSADSQLSIVSATMPRSIYQILDSVVETDSLEKISTERTHQVLPHVLQTFYRVGMSQKQNKLIQLVQQSIQNGENVMIFSNKTKTCDWISLTLNEMGIDTVQLNAGMPEILRRGRFKEFREGNVSVISCTDIASRGLDTINVRHIINFDFPKFMADYVHRCGRTGRVGSHLKCRVSNFVTTDSDVRLVQEIETAVRLMNDLPNVNGNISKIIHHRYLKFGDEKMRRSLP